MAKFRQETGLSSYRAYFEFGLYEQADPLPKQGCLHLPLVPRSDPLDLSHKQYGPKHPILRSKPALMRMLEQRHQCPQDWARLAFPFLQPIPWGRWSLRAAPNGTSVTQASH